MKYKEDKDRKAEREKSRKRKERGRSPVSDWGWPYRLVVEEEGVVMSDA